jgi:hypothetical protein
MSASSIDPDIQAAFAGTAPAASSNANIDPDILAAFKEPATGSYDTGYDDSVSRSVEDKAKQVGGAANSLYHSLVGGYKGLYTLATTGSSDKAADAVNAEQGKSYKPPTMAPNPAVSPAREAAIQSGTSLPSPTALGDIAANHNAPPWLSTALATAPTALASTVATPRSMGGPTPPSTAIEEAHPLSSAAQNELDEMQEHAKGAAAAGVELPPRQVSPAQAYVNNAARQDLNLPKNAPVTDGLLDAAQKQNVSPAYEAVKSTPAFELGPKYQEAIGKVDLSKIDPQWRPPTDGTMTGARSVELSSQLRSTARDLYQDADNYNLRSADRNAARQEAQAHYQAAKAVEGGFREAAETTDAARSAETGIDNITTRTDVANNWDQARTYNAKVEAWRGALDGAGNVSGPKIKKLLNDEPVSGPMKEVGSVVAQYPELFRGTRLQTPTEGLLKRGIRAVAPMAGAAAGEAIAPGTLGSMGGAALGEYAVNKTLGTPYR